MLGYRIERSLDSGGSWATLVANSGSDQTTLSDISLSNGVTYTYRVAALTVAGTGAWSDAANATPVGLPGTPLGVGATPADGGLVVTWSPPTDTGGTPITSYVIDLFAGSSWQLGAASVTGSTLSTTVSGLTNGSTYRVRVTAVNAQGSSPASGEVSGVPAAPASVPTALAAAPLASGVVRVTWSTPASDGGYPITGYRVERATSGAGPWTAVTANSGTTSATYDVSGLTGGQLYYFRIAAVTSVGVGASATTSSTAVTGASVPTTLVTVIGDSQATLTWGSPVDAGGGTVSAYRVETSSDGSLWVAYGSDLPASTFTATITGLTNGTTIFARVSAVNAAGAGTPAITSATPSTVATAPTAVSATAAGPGVLTVTWTTPTSTGGTAISGYRLQVSTDSGANWTTSIVSTGTTATATLLTGLTTNVATQVRVAAITATGPGPYSIATTATPLSLASSVRSLSAISANTALNLTWSTPLNTGGAAISGYQIEQSADGASWVTVVADTGSPAVAYTVSGLTNGTAVYVRVSPITPVGVGSGAVTSATPATTAGAPTAITAGAADAGATLTWTAPVSNGGASISGYRVDILPAGGVWATAVADTGSASTSTNLSALANGTSYSVRVAALTSQGLGAWSSSDSVTPLAAPGAVRSLSAAPGNQQVVLTWLAPITTGARPVTGYRVDQSTDGGGSWSNITNTGAASLTATVTGVTNGSSYLFRVTPLTSLGDGATANVSATPRTTPDAPSALAVTTVSSGIVVLGWTEPSTTGGFPVIGYRVETSTNGGTSWTVYSLNSGSASTSTSISGLVDGTEYTFRVAAITTVGTGTYSTTVTGTPLAAAAAPAALSATPGDTELNLVWSAPTSTGGGAVTDYVVEQSTSGVAWTLAARTATRSARISGLSNGTTYLVRVSAVTAAGTGQSAVTAAVPFTLSSAPTSVSVVRGQGAGTLDVSWTAPASAGGYGISGYRVETGPSASGPWTVAILNTGSTSTTTTLTGIANGGTTWVRVSAITAAGGGAASAPGSGAAIGVADVPTGLVATSGNGQATLVWVAPANTGGSPIVGYRIATSADGVTWTDVIADSGSTLTTATVVGLPNGASTLIRVAAITAAGPGDYAIATVTPAGPPAAPTGLAAVAGNAQVALSWSAPTSTGGYSITGYRIQYSTVSAPTTWYMASEDTASTATAYTVTALTNGDQYRFRVAAITPAGKGADSALVSATPIRVSDAVTGITATPSGDGVVELAWTAPVNTGGSAITGYRVSVSTDGGTSWSDLAASTASTLTTYAAAGLTSGTIHIFAVRALTAAGESVPALQSTTPVSAADSPTALSAVPSNGTLTLSWTAPGNTGGSAVTGYRIETSTDGVAFSVVNANTGSATTSAVVPGLTNGTSYVVRVSAVTTAGAGAGGLISGTPVDVPSAPATVQATPSADRANVTWAEGANHGAPISSTEVRIRPTAGAWVTLATVPGGTTTALIPGLHQGTAYEVSVRSLNAIGASPWTSPSAFTTLSLPSVPVALSLARGSGQLSATWFAPVNSGGLSVTSYTVQSSADGVTWGTAQTVATLSAVESGLVNGETRFVRVAAVTSAGTGPFAVAVGIPGAAPSAPLLVDAVATGDGDVLVTWQRPATDGGLGVTNYRVETSSFGGGPWTAVTTTSITATVLTGLTGSTYIRVIAVNAAGDGIPGIPGAAVTPTVNTTAPSGLLADGVDSGVTLSWRAPAVPGTGFDGYLVETSPDGVTWTIATPSAALTAASTSASIAGTNGQLTLIRLTPVDSTVTPVGSGAITAAVPSTVPGAPTALSVDSAGVGRVSVRWTAPTSNGGLAVTGYQVETSSDGSAWSTAIADTGTSTTAAVLSGVSGTVYARVSAINGEGVGLASASAHGVASDVPSTPASVTVDYGDGSISVTWDSPVSEGGAAVIGYELETSVDGVTWSGTRVSAASTGVSIMSAPHTATLTGFTNGTRVLARVAAVNAAGVGAAAYAASVPMTVPAQPVLTSVTGSAAGQLTVDWTAPANGGSPITEYRVEWSADGSSWPLSQRVVAPGSATSADLPGLPQGASVRVRIRAVNIVGAGAASSASAGTLVPVQVSAPTGLMVTPGDGQLAMTWTSGATVTGWRVETSANGSTWTTVIANTGSLATTYTVTGLTNGQARFVRVAGITAQGLTAWASSVGTPIAVPSVARSVGATQTGPGESTIVWTAPLNDGGSAINEYRLRISSNGGSTWAPLISVDASARAYVATGLVAGTTYTFEVKAVTAFGLSAGATAHVTAQGVSQAVTSLIATPSPGLVDLAWGAPTDSGGSVITGYRVESSLNGSTWTVQTTTTARTTTARVSGLANGIPVFLRVIPLTAVGDGAPTQVVATPVTTPGAPSAISATPEDGSVTLTWGAPASTGGSVILGYKVESSVATGVWAVVNANTGSTLTTLTIGSLSNGTPIAFRVSAINSAGTGATLASARVTPSRASGAVRSLTARAGDARIALSWDAPVSAGGAAVTGYRIEKSTDGATWSAVVGDTGSTATTYTVTGLTNGTTYYVRVIPMVASLLGATAVASAIPATLPGRVTNVRAVSRDVGEASVTWTAPASNGGYPVIGYSIEKSIDGRTWSAAVASTGSASTSYLATGLVAGQATQLRVLALTVAGSGAASVAASVTPLALAGAPRSLAISSVATGVRLTWLAPRSNGGSAITGYRVETSVDGVTWKVQSRSGSSPLALATAAIDGATLVRISAVTAAGVGAYAIASLGGGTVTPPDVPTDLTPQTNVDVPAGESQATIAGKKVPTKVVPDADGTGVTVAAGAQRLSLSGIRADGSKAAVGADGVLRLAPGLKVAVNLQDAPVRTRAVQPRLKVGSTASIYLIGDQTFVLGSVKVTAQGIALGQLSVPKTATPGTYVLQVNAFATTGDVLSLSVGVLLVEPKPGHDGKGGTLTSAVYFKDAASALSSQMKAKLRKMVADIPAGKTATIVIVGFKPAQGSTSSDHFLAKARAEATEKYLASLGFSANVDVRADGISSHSNWRGRRVVVTITF